MRASPQVFISYALPDRARIEALYQRLSDEGLKPWLDEKDIPPGADWELSVREAIRDSGFFLSCLSNNSVDAQGRTDKRVQRELAFLWKGVNSDTFLVPVRLEECKVPENLAAFEPVDLFADDGWHKLLETFDEVVSRRKSLNDAFAHFMSEAGEAHAEDVERRPEVLIENEILEGPA